MFMPFDISQWSLAFTLGMRNRRHGLVKKEVDQQLLPELGLGGLLERQQRNS